MVTAATCTANGTDRYTWKTTTYGTFTFDVTIPKTGHKYVDTVIAPTCTEQGYTMYTCSRCSDNYKDTYVDALRHEYENGVCKICGAKDPDYTPPVSFEDLAEGAFYYDAVMWAVARDPQVTAGTDTTHFSPNASCTRAQVVTFLWRAKGQPEPTKTDNPFIDVKDGAYYYKAVLWAVENGVTAGTGADTFSPNASCTRAQVVTFLWRAAGQPKPGNTNNPFTDVKDTAYYIKAVLWAVEKGITTGTGAGKFSPNKTCTRGQVVTFLHRDLVK